MKFPTIKTTKIRLALLADGAHVNTQRWCEGLSRSGADIYLLSFTPADFKSITYVPIPVPKLPGKLHYFAALSFVRQMIRRIRPDLVVGYSVTGYGTLAALTGFRPLVQVTSGSDILWTANSFLLQRLVRSNLRRADLVTAWAPHMAQVAFRLGVREDRLFVLPRGIPCQEFASVRSLPPSQSDIARIICTRALKADYNFEGLLSAMRLLDEEGVDFTLTVAGDGPQREALTILTQKLGLKHRVRFVGFVPNDQLPFLLAKHYLYVSLVASDGVSASLLEAMAVGLIPIVPKHPANSFWVRQHETGLLLNELTPVAIAKAIHEAISNTALRQRAWEENPKLVRDKADMHCNSEQYVARFRQLVNNWHSESNQAKPACG